jgi:hypothetical protein
MQQEMVSSQEECLYHGFSILHRLLIQRKTGFNLEKLPARLFIQTLYKVILDFKSIIDLNTDPSRIVEMKQYGDTQNQIATAELC